MEIEEINKVHEKFKIMCELGAIKQDFIPAMEALVDLAILAGQIKAVRELRPSNRVQLTNNLQSE